MFKQRLITALILIPCVLGVIYSGWWWLFSLLSVLLLGALGWEWSNLIPLTTNMRKIGFIMLLMALVWPAHYFLSLFLYIDLLMWCGIFMALISFPTSQKYWGYRWVVSGLALLCLPVFSSTLWSFYELSHGANGIVYVLCLVWATDSGAYFMGKICGRHRLIPLVSPGKTMEGALGGIMLALLVMLLGYIYIQPTSAWRWFLTGTGTVVMAMIGDLFISMLKRRCHLKDTGALIPGHGGILDRLDSLLAALPFFFLSYGFCFA